MLKIKQSVQRKCSYKWTKQQSPVTNPSLPTGCFLLTVTERQSYVISLMTPPPALTQQQETGDTQTYKSVAVWGEKPFWYNFHHLLSKTNPLLVPVGASVGPFQSEQHNGYPHLEQCLWLAWSVLAPILQFTEKGQAHRRDSTGNMRTPSNSTLLQLHTIWITSQTVSI